MIRQFVARYIETWLCVTPYRTPWHTPFKSVSNVQQLMSCYRYVSYFYGTRLSHGYNIQISFVLLSEHVLVRSLVRIDVPGAPSTPTARCIEAQIVIVEWSEPDTNNAPITEYAVK